MEAVDLKFVDTPALESIRNSDPVTIQPEMIGIGQFYPQGDVALERLESVPDGCYKVTDFPLQIAPGTTQGSRHCWDSSDGIEAFALKESHPLRGLIYRLSKTRTLEHPEHANQTYVVEDEPLVFGVRYQRQHAEELRRIQD